MLFFFVERDFYSKTARIGVDMALCLSIAIAMLYNFSKIPFDVKYYTYLF